MSTESDPTVSLSAVTVAQQVADIVSAFVGKQHVTAADLPALIASTHAAVAAMYGAPASAASAEPAIEKPTPAAIRKSITPDGIVSFIDGKPYQTLRRHLTKHGHTPESYRAAYGLPADYPTTAPAYSEKRSALAKSLGLGVPGVRAVKEAA